MAKRPDTFRMVLDSFTHHIMQPSPQPNIVATRFNSKYHKPWLFYHAQMQPRSQGSLLPALWERGWHKWPTPFILTPVVFMHAQEGNSVGAVRKVSPNWSQETMTCHSFYCFSIVWGQGNAPLTTPENTITYHNTLCLSLQNLA